VDSFGKRCLTSGGVEINAPTSGDVEINALNTELVKFNNSNFEKTSYKDAKGEWRPLYKMTKDGFMLLVMGFRGAVARALKIEYINEFNRMQSFINTKYRAEYEKYKLESHEALINYKITKETNLLLERFKYQEVEYLLQYKEKNNRIIK